MTVRISAVLSRAVTILIVLAGVIIFTGCEARPEIEFLHAGRWVATGSKLRPLDPGLGSTQTYSSSHDVIYPLRPATLSGREPAEIIISNDGNTALYISSTGAEITYQLGPDTMCFFDTVEPWCFLWKVKGERLFFCDLPPPENCRLFERKEQ